MSDQRTFTFDAQNGASLVGQLVTVDEAVHIDGSRYTLNWRPDNLARVGLRTQDTTGLVRCNRAATCHVAEACASGRPHKATWQDNLDGPQTCYDHKPYIVGGVQTWVVAMPTSPDSTETGKSRP